METQFKSSTLNANLAELPMFKGNNFSMENIGNKLDTFRKGEKNLFWFLKLAIFGAAAWGIWTYVLPTAFVKLGQTLALVATGALLVFTVICAPAFVRWIRKFARFLHKTAIKYDPFGTFAETRQKIVQNQATFRVSKGAINTLQQDMAAQAVICEKEVKTGQVKILSLQQKAEQIKADMAKMVADKGPDVKGEDAYVELLNDLQKTLADGQRFANKLNQSTLYVSKYGTRANIMKKMVQKLSMVETGMDIKLADFDATIEMLKKDYDFGQRSNAATSAAKSAMLFSKGWEFDYALEVVNQTISADIAITAGNLKDIDTLTAGFSMDSDESFASLNLIADRIKTGADVLPTAKQYANPEYKLTAEDKRNSNGFTEVF